MLPKPLIEVGRAPVSLATCSSVAHAPGRGLQAASGAGPQPDGPRDRTWLGSFHLSHITFPRSLCLLTNPRGLSCRVTGGVCASSGPRHTVMFTKPSSGVCVSIHAEETRAGDLRDLVLSSPPWEWSLSLLAPLPPGAPLCRLKVTDAPLSEAGPSVMAPLPGSGPGNSGVRRGVRTDGVRLALHSDDRHRRGASVRPLLPLARA